MITNDRQFKIVKSQIEAFQKSLDLLSSTSLEVENVHPKILEAQKNATSYKINELLTEVKEYEDLKAGKTLITEIRDLTELPVALIKARIANGLTQAELADRLEVKEQQIQRYESDRYETASLKTLQKVAQILHVKFSAEVQIKEVEAPDIYNVKMYPFKQMLQRRWFRNFSGSLNEAIKQSPELIANLYYLAGITNMQLAFNRKSVRTGSVINDFALNIWYAQVIIKAREQELTTFFDRRIVTDDWLRSLSQLSFEQNGPQLAVSLLRNSGIRVVIEPQLEGTHLDGAALLLDDIYPIIALTLRYDRLDNFWFVLFHELAHVVLHLGTEYNMIFDDLDSNIDGIEKEADEYALNASIPDKVWKRSLVRFSPTAETITNQAHNLKIHPALIAGRIRRETGKYFLFNDLIGQNEVRKLFLTELNN
jgi:HTH-type transcriptional regulator/antitoxin HigA